MQAHLYDMGINSLSMLSAVATDRGTLETLAKARLGIGIDLRPTDAAKFATLFLQAWQSAKKRVMVRDELDAEAEAQKASLQEPLQQEILDKLRNNFYSAVIMSPPCATWSRAPWAN